MALCYYKLDYYDVSQEVLQVYLQVGFAHVSTILQSVHYDTYIYSTLSQTYKDSATAINLKACNHYRLFNGKAAEAEIKTLQDIASPSFEYAQDLVKHNLVGHSHVPR